MSSSASLTTCGESPPTKKRKYDVPELFREIPRKSWRDFISEIADEDADFAKSLSDIDWKVRRLYEQQQVFPKREDLWRSLSFFDPKETKVVIIGQDPYINGEADGLAFSCSRQATKLPPSLRNVLHVAGYESPSVLDGDLSKWARQGVLLLNSTLTVNRGSSNSHKWIGWQRFTKRLIEELCARSERSLIFLLWGAEAQQFYSSICKNSEGVENEIVKHKVLMTSHPSPFAYNRGFKNCDHFSCVNKILGDRDKIVW